MRRNDLPTRVAMWTDLMIVVQSERSPTRRIPAPWLHLENTSENAN